MTPIRTPHSRPSADNVLRVEQTQRKFEGALRVETLPSLSNSPSTSRSVGYVLPSWEGSRSEPWMTSNVRSTSYL